VSGSDKSKDHVTETVFPNLRLYRQLLSGAITVAVYRSISREQLAAKTTVNARGDAKREAEGD
jgi:hypothetical protein